MNSIFTKQNIKQGRLVNLIAILLFILSSLTILGQTPELIPVNAGANQYPITFTTNDQNEFVLEFTENVTGGIDPSCWTVKIGTDVYNPFSVSISNDLIFLFFIPADRFERSVRINRYFSFFICELQITSA